MLIWQASELARLTSPEYLEQALTKVGVVDAEWQTRATKAESQLAEAREEIGRIRRETLEEAAKVADAHAVANYSGPLDPNAAMQLGAQSIAAAIRSIGEDR